MAISILGVCLTVLVLIFAYVWKDYHKIKKDLLERQKVLNEGQKRTKDNDAGFREA